MDRQCGLHLQAPAHACTLLPLLMVSRWIGGAVATPKPLSRRQRRLRPTGGSPAAAGLARLGAQQEPFRRGVEHHMDLALMAVGVSGAGQPIGEHGTATDGPVSEEEEGHGSSDGAPMTPWIRSVVQRARAGRSCRTALVSGARHDGPPGTPLVLERGPTQPLFRPPISPRLPLRPSPP
jgi:hypothetical protein